MDVLIENWSELLAAFGRTAEMALMAGVMALVIGFFLAALRVSPIALGRFFGAAYVNVVRNTPLLAIMIIFAFGLPELGLVPELNLNDLFGMDDPVRLLSFSSFYIFATTALGLYTAAFICEAVRSGINSISVGQAEAARSIGMTFSQTLSQVVLPQAFRAVIPPIASTLIAMTKNTTVALAVGVTEATFLMKKLTEDNATALFTIFVAFAIGYMILVGMIAGVASILERKLKVA